MASSYNAYAVYGVDVTRYIDDDEELKIVDTYHHLQLVPPEVVDIVAKNYVAIKYRIIESLINRAVSPLHKETRYAASGADLYCVPDDAINLDGGVVLFGLGVLKFPLSNDDVRISEYLKAAGAEWSIWVT